MDKNTNKIIETVEKLMTIGFRPVINSNQWKKYLYQSGSIANYVEVYIGEIKEVVTPADTKVLAAFVELTESSESGYETCDHYLNERRTIRVDELFDYLKSHSIG